MNLKWENTNPQQKLQSEGTHFFQPSIFSLKSANVGTAHLGDLAIQLFQASLFFFWWKMEPYLDTQ